MNASDPTLITTEPSRKASSRYFDVFLTLWRNSVVREMQFKVNFILWIIVEFLWFALHLCFMVVLYSHTDRIGTWTKWEVVMLVGTSHLLQQVFTALFFNSCTQLPEMIRTGKLDFMLLLPINTRFIITFRQVDLGSFMNALSAICVMVYAGIQLHISPNLLQMVGFLALALCGVLIHYCLMFSLATISFWSVRAQGIVWGYYNLFQIARMPDSIFRGTFKAVFTFILPILLVSNVPTKVIVKPLENPWQIPLLLLMSVACFSFSEWAWRTSLRHYTSASS